MKAILRLTFDKGKPVLDSFVWPEDRPVPPIVTPRVKKRRAETARQRQRQRDEEKN